ncbi:MAG: hypothetical protein ACRD2L_23235 [Terriglobia bacterium]
MKKKKAKREKASESPPEMRMKAADFDRMMGSALGVAPRKTVRKRP